MPRRIPGAFLLLPLLIACGDDGPVASGDGDGVPGAGTRYMSTGAAIEVASADTVYTDDEPGLRGEGTFSTSITSSWIHDQEILATDDADSIVVHYEVVEGEVDLELFTAPFDTTGNFGADVAGDIDVQQSWTLGVGDDPVRVVLRRP